MAANGELSAKHATAVLALILFVSNLVPKSTVQAKYQVLQNEKEDSETLYRAAVAVGNLVS